MIDRNRNRRGFDWFGCLFPLLAFALAVCLTAFALVFINNHCLPK